jgi:hypothetical protein
VPPVDELPEFDVPVVDPFAEVPLLLLLLPGAPLPLEVPVSLVVLFDVPFAVEVDFEVPVLFFPELEPLFPESELPRPSSPLEPSPFSDASTASSALTFDFFDALCSFAASTSVARPNDSARPPSIAPAATPRRRTNRRLTRSLSTLVPLPTECTMPQTKPPKAHFPRYYDMRYGASI